MRSTADHHRRHRRRWGHRLGASAANLACEAELGVIVDRRRSDDLDASWVPGA